MYEDSEQLALTSPHVTLKLSSFCVYGYIVLLFMDAVKSCISAADFFTLKLLVVFC